MVLRAVFVQDFGLVCYTPPKPSVAMVSPLPTCSDILGDQWGNSLTTPRRVSSWVVRTSHHTSGMRCDTVSPGSEPRTCCPPAPPWAQWATFESPRQVLDLLGDCGGDIECRQALDMLERGQIHTCLTHMTCVEAGSEHPSTCLPLPPLPYPGSPPG